MIFSEVYFSIVSVSSSPPFPFHFHLTRSFTPRAQKETQSCRAAEMKKAAKAAEAHAAQPESKGGKEEKREEPVREEDDDDGLPVLGYFSHRDLDNLGALGPPRMSPASFSAKEHKGFYRTGEGPGSTLKLPGRARSREGKRTSLQPLPRTMVSTKTQREKQKQKQSKKKRKKRLPPRQQSSSEVGGTRLQQSQRRKHRGGLRRARGPLDESDVFRERAALEADQFSKFQLEQKLADQRKEQSVLRKRYRNKSMRKKAKANAAELHALEAMIATGARICRRLEMRLEGHCWC